MKASFADLPNFRLRHIYLSLLATRPLPRSQDFYAVVGFPLQGFWRLLMQLLAMALLALSCSYI